MTDRQQAAIAAPCGRAVETLNQTFRRIEKTHGGTWSTILSINK